MSILAYIESKNNKPKKSSFEVVSYAKELSKQLSLELVVVAINIDDSSWKMAGWNVNKFCYYQVINPFDVEIILIPNPFNTLGIDLD